MWLIEPFLFIGWSLLPHYDMDIDTLVNSKEAKLYFVTTDHSEYNFINGGRRYKEFTGSNVNHLALD